MSLNGNLETISLDGILQLLCQEGKTGVCRVNNGNQKYQIFLLEGDIVYAIESGKESRLGRLLTADGRLDPAELEQCMEIAARKQQALGKALVENGYLSTDILQEYLYKPVQEIVATLFMWDQGDFVYTDTPLNLKWLVVVRLNTTQLIMDGLRQRDEALDRER